MNINKTYLPYYGYLIRAIDTFILFQINLLNLLGNPPSINFVYKSTYPVVAFYHFILKKTTLYVVRTLTHNCVVYKLPSRLKREVSTFKTLTAIPYQISSIESVDEV